MATSVEQATEEQPQKNAHSTATATTRITLPSQLRQAAQAQVTASGGHSIPGVNPQDFIDANRIHIKGGSLFVDPYLVIHPRELDPANEAKLRGKLALTYSLNNPSFFESPERSAIALNLGQLIPVSIEAKKSKLLDEIQQFNTQVDTGIDPALAHELQDKKTPFAAIVRDVTQHPAADPVGVETLKNGLAAYLLVREKLTANGNLDKLPKYVGRTGTSDQVLAELSSKIGITPLAFREAALKGGLDGIGQLLGLDPLYVQNVRELVDYAATQDFGYNLVEHWHLGRQLQGLKTPLAEKIKAGMDARITAKIDDYRTQVHHHFDVPDAIKLEEKRVAESLMLLEPVQRALAFKQGYEICHTTDVTADDIAFYHGINGLHRRAANDLRDMLGTYRIYTAGRGDLSLEQETRVHEFAHMFIPAQLTPEAVAKVDALAASDQKRFDRFQVMMDTHFAEFEKLFKAYQVGNEQEKAAVIAAANQEFAIYDFKAEGLFPYLRDAHEFQFAVKRASDTLSVEGARYNRSNYNSPTERFREVVSRFAELKQVKYRGDPEFVQFLAPGLNSIWETIYIPHLTKVFQGLENGSIKPTYRENAAAHAPLRDETQPKVENHPTEPAQPPAAPIHPVTEKQPLMAPEAAPTDQAIDAQPDSKIARAGLQITERLAPAMNALKQMGVSF